MEDDVEAAKLLVLETIAESDDTLLEKYLEGEELTTEELFEGLRRGIADGVIIPVLAPSAAQMIGVDRILDAIAGRAPRPGAPRGWARGGRGECERGRQAPGRHRRPRPEPGGPLALDDAGRQGAFLRP